MAEVKNIERLQKNLQAMTAKYAEADKVDVAVGYAAAHALFVHENRQMKWRGKPRRSGVGVYWGPAGRAGFLLDVARERSAQLSTVVRTLLQQGKKVAQALLAAGLMLQRFSQKEVPVEYGNLRASAFTRLERIS